MMIMSWCCSGDGDGVTGAAVLVAIALAMALTGAVSLLELLGLVAIISVNGGRVGR